MVLVTRWELASETVNYNTKRCVKSFQIRDFSWSVFSRIRTQCFVSLRIQPNCGKIRTRKNSILGHFSRNENHVPIWANLRTLQVKQQVSEAVVRRHQSLKTSQTPQENICVFISWPATLLKRDFDTDVFLRNLQISKNTFFIKQLQWLLLRFNSCFQSSPRQKPMRLSPMHIRFSWKRYLLSQKSRSS